MKQILPSQSKNQKPTERPLTKVGGFWFPGLFLLVFFLLNMGTYAQQTLNATGGSAKIGGDVFSYSIGEMVLVSTVNTSNNYFTQGLLQNDDVNLRIYADVFLSEGLEIYPNPVADMVYLQPSFSSGGELALQLYDLRGRLVMQENAQLISGTEKQQMDLSLLQEGTYLLQAELEQNGKVYRHSFKIVKFSN